MSQAADGGRPADGAPRGPGFWAEFRDAVSARTVALVLGVLGLQLGFILSYVGAFHAPTPQHVPVQVSAPAQADRLAAQLNQIPGTPLRANVASSADAARAAVLDGSSSAALVVNPQGTADTLLVASGGGVSVVTAVQSVVEQVEANQHRTITLQDIVPLQAGDGRGLTGFYLVIGWLVGGYLMASLLGVSGGARPSTPRRALIRLAAAVPYAVASGLFGTLIVDQALGALTGHFMALWWLGALLVFGAAAVTLAFQTLLGVIGIGVTVLVYVVLGNPSAGGAYQSTLLPPFWRALSDALPNGAGVDTVRRITYFAGQGITGHLVVLAIYAVAGVVVCLVAANLLHRRSGPPPVVAAQS